MSDTKGAAGWALGAIAGVVAYFLIDILLVFLRPEFSVLHNAESDYGSKGHDAWVMDANFLLRCALSLAVVYALALTAPGMRTGLVLLSVWAVGSGLLAFFPDDPNGVPQHGTAKVHGLLAVIVFLCVIVGTRLVTRRLRRVPGWGPVVPALSILSWGAIVPVLLLGHARFRPNSLGGLWEKIFLAIELCWFMLAAAWIVRLDREPAGRLAGGPAPGGESSDRRAGAA